MKEYKLTLVSFTCKGVRYSYFVNALYVDGKSYVSYSTIGKLLDKEGLSGHRFVGT